MTVLQAAKRRQAAERLALGEHYRAGEYVVCNEIGDPYNPAVLSRYWAKAVKVAGVRHIKLHGGRHTAATLMHLDGVPVAVIAAWIGHKDRDAYDAAIRALPGRRFEGRWGGAGPAAEEEFYLSCDPW